MADTQADQLCTTMKTYGSKPRVFKLEDGEEFMLGSEVGNYMRLFRGDLYKKYPSLWRRKMTAEERRLASEQIGYSYCNISSNVLLVKKTEVEEILNGLDDKYRVSSGFDSYAPSVERSSSHHSGAGGRGSKKNSWLSQIPNYSYHLDAVPCATPINRCTVNAKKIKSFPTWYNMHPPTVFTIDSLSLCI